MTSGNAFVINIINSKSFCHEKFIIRFVAFNCDTFAIIFFKSQCS